MLTQTWRPRGEPICIEIYSTGRANVSKARNYTDLLETFSRMIPELLRYSSSSLGVVNAPEDMDEFEDDVVEPQPALLSALPPQKERPQTALDETPKEASIQAFEEESNVPDGTRPMDRLRSLLQEPHAMSPPSSYNMDFDDENLYNESNTDAPDWWQPTAQVVQVTQHAPVHAAPAESKASLPAYSQVYSHSTTRHRIVQRLYQSNSASAQPVGKSKQARLMSQAPPRAVHPVQPPVAPAAPQMTIPECLDEDSDDPMSGWALGPGV